MHGDTRSPAPGLAGNTALVTGSGRRIGAAIAEALAARGCAIALHDRVASDELAARARTLAGSHAVKVAPLTGDRPQGGPAAELFRAPATRPMPRRRAWPKPAGAACSR